MRVKLFVDFWNFQLQWNQFHGREPVVRIPWNPLLFEVLVQALGRDAEYAGTHVFASYDPLSKKDLQLKKFLNVMDSFPGFDVTLKERKPLHHMRCSNDGCRLEISQCPHCHQEIRRTVEKGVDTAIVTDLIRLGIDNHYDRAILIAGDADHVPAVEFLGARMKQVTHAWFKGHSNELRNACWDHLYFDDLMSKLIV
ncbi:MAG: NYN domain-containing protein [Acidobacteria bacterium]|nr:NYN domain-containing protein [Acidobacteriota bacterium]